MKTQCQPVPVSFKSLTIILAFGLFAGAALVPRTADAAAGCAGSLDPSFQVPSSFPTLWSSYPPILALKVQPDGKVLVADATFDCGEGRATYLPPIRFNADGSLDTNYVSNPADVAPHTRVLQPDGKVLELQFGIDQAPMQLVRLNADGTRDTSFVADVPEDFQPQAIALQPGGGVLVGGGRISSFTIDGMTKQWLSEPVLRLLANGSRDPAFHTGLTLHVGPDSRDGRAYLLRDLVVDEAGRIYICGFFTRAGEVRRTDIARLNPDGTLDFSFEPDLEVCTGCDIDAQDTVSALGIAPGDKLVIAGRLQTINGQPRHAVARLHTSDAGCAGVITFAAERMPVSETNSQVIVTVLRTGGLGQQVSVRYETYTNAYPEFPEAAPGRDYQPGAGVLAFAPGETSKSIAIPLRDDAVCEPNERLWIRLTDPTGGASLRSPAQAYVLIMDDDAAGRPGNVDTSFEPNLSIFDPYNSVRAIAADAQHIWLAGRFSHVDGMSRSGFARLHANARLDAGFDPAINGTVAVIASDPASGKVLIGGGFSTVDGMSCPNLARFNSDGAVDATFHTPALGAVSAIALAPGDRIVVGGGFGVARINTDGKADPNFHSGSPASVNGNIYTLAVQPDGKIIVGGFLQAVENQPIHELARLNADGSLDTAFRPASATNTSFAYVKRVAVQTDGKILVAGYFSQFGGLSYVGLLRLSPDGSLDPTFQPLLGGVIDDLVLQADGRILVLANYREYAEAGRPLRGLIRLLPNGLQDPSFFVAPVWPAYENTALALQPDGDVLVAGTYTQVNGYNRPGFFRLHGDHTGARPEDPGSISFGAPQYDIAENGGALTVKAVRVWGNHGAVSARFTTREGTATAETDYVPASVLVSFADGEASEKSITVPILDDFVGEDGGETLELALDEPAGGTTLGCFAGAQVAIVENDEIVQFAAPCYVVSETNSGFRFEFNVRGVRDVPVKVEYATHDGTAMAGRDYTATTGIATLSGSGSGYLPWVPILNDNVVEGPEWFTISLRIVDGTATLGSRSTATVYIVDDEAPGPVIVRQPVAQTRVVGQAASFEVGAIGTAPLTYQWLFEGEEIAGATGAALTLANLQAGNNGLYEVEVSDGAGKVASQQVSLTVLQPPTGPGSLDLAFDPSRGGTLSVFQEQYSMVNVVAVQPDGNILVGGSFAQFDGVHCAGLVRLRPDGSQDKSFAVAPYPWWSSAVNALALAGDGKIVVAFGRLVSPAEGHFSGVLRLNSDGSVDPSFQMPTDIDYNFVNAVAVQADGKVLLGGVIEARNEPKYRQILRLLPGGGLDTSFKPVPLSGDGEPRNAVNNILVQPDGKIVLLGCFGRPGTDSGALVRLWPDGSIDTSFDHGLRFWTESSGTLALQADGKLVVGASGWDGTKGVGLARLRPDGTLDPTFVPPPIEREVASLALLPDGSLLVATNQWDEGGLMHVRPDGTIDENFRVQLSPTEGACVKTIVPLPNGQALIGGRFGFINGYPATNLARINVSLRPAFVTRQLPYQGGAIVRLVAAPLTRIAVYAVEDQPPGGLTVSKVSHGGTFDAITGRVKFGPFYDHEPRTLTYEILPPPWGIHGSLGVFTFNGSASADGQSFSIAGDQHLTIAGMMPPDTNPADYAINITEVTGYGAAWRKGEDWPIEPNPIPISYVTRAAALWRWGECYTVDARLAEEPLWWMPCPTPHPADAHPASLERICVTRQLPPSFVPGEALTVMLNTVAAAGTAAQAIEELPPAGWKVTAVMNGGTLDEVNGKVKWGPFLDAAPHLLRYQVVPPPTADSAGRFTGVGSFDGVNSPILGATTVLESCRLTMVSPSRAGQFTLTLSGRVGARFLIETSTDLKNWSTQAVISNLEGHVGFSIPDAPGSDHRFYRARLIE